MNWYGFCLLTEHKTPIYEKLIAFGFGRGEAQKGLLPVGSFAIRDGSDLK